MSEQDRRLARARLTAFITAPSWARSPHAVTQAEEILTLVLDTKSCAATMQHPHLPGMLICHREEGHDNQHFADGGYTWELSDAEIEQRQQAEIDREVAAHEQYIHDTMEDR